MASTAQFQQVSGILFKRSVRSSFASFSLVQHEYVDKKQPQKEALQPSLIRIQFVGDVKELRSFCRRSYKLGDLLNVEGKLSDQINDASMTAWNNPRIIVDVTSSEDAKKYVKVQEPQKWTMTECQRWQNLFFPPKNDQGERNNKSPKQKKQKNIQPENSGNDVCERSNHGGGLGKRIQAEKVAQFLIDCIMEKYLTDENIDFGDLSQLHQSDPHTYSKFHEKAIEYLNSGTGVVDVAGGSGHLSMALGIAGIKSTVIDTRPGVGRLPGRDRKIWKSHLKRRETRDPVMQPLLYCHPVVPFETKRAWFGSRPDGVDSSFRHPDEAQLPLVDESSDLIANASAIISLHPDEATGDVVRVAVKNSIPFVVVPCCVFCRLFPERRKKSTNDVVSTYQDLLEYLRDHDSSIQQSQLPFDGKNTVLWSTF